MRGLLGSGVLAAWDAGQGQHPLERALSVLRAGFPEMDRRELASLTIGQRDSLLIALRRGTFGDTLSGFAECVECGERLEFSLSSSSFAAPATLPGGEIEIDGFQIRFQLPTTYDLAAITRSGEAEMGRRELLDRCVLEASFEGQVWLGSALPDEVGSKLAKHMAEMDPAADTVFDLTCPACAHRWQAIFDIESFFWAEITTQAKRLFTEVHTLATAYGWDEARILEMSVARRQAYLDMVGA